MLCILRRNCYLGLASFMLLVGFFTEVCQLRATWRWCWDVLKTDLLLQEFARLHLESHKHQFLKTQDADFCT